MGQMDSAYPLSHGLSGEQLDLIYSGLRNIEQDFWRFDRENPSVYRKLVNLARSAKAAGFEQYSMDAIFHRLRWHHNIERKSAEPFKLNDHFTSFYARLIMQREPDLCDFFEIREQRSKGKK
jgi:hypothetical protein